MPQPKEVEALVAKLVAIHGEAGVCPTAADWQAIMALSHGPVELANMLKFKPEVTTAAGPISGAAAYGKYAAGNAAAFARAGGERIFFGHVGHMFAFGDVEHWDAMIVTRYPSATALAGMWLDPEFIAAHANRLDGVERSLVLIFKR